MGWMDSKPAATVLRSPVPRRTEAGVVRWTAPPAGTVASIYLETSDLNYNVTASDTHKWRINAVLEMELDGTELDITGHSLRFGTNANIFFNPAGTSISIQANDMVFDVTSGDVFSFDIAGTPIMALLASTLQFNGGVNIELGALAGNGYLQVEALTTPATPPNGAGRYYTKELASITTPFFIGDDGTEIGIFLTNFTGSVGTAGSNQNPVVQTLSSTVANLDAAFGSAIGCKGVYNTGQSFINVAWKVAASEWLVIACPDNGGAVISDHIT